MTVNVTASVRIVVGYVLQFRQCNFAAYQERFQPLSNIPLACILSTLSPAKYSSYDTIIQIDMKGCLDFHNHHHALRYGFK